MINDDGSIATDLGLMIDVLCVYLVMINSLVFSLTSQDFQFISCYKFCLIDNLKSYHLIRFCMLFYMKNWLRRNIVKYKYLNCSKL